MYQVKTHYVRDGEKRVQVEQFLAEGDARPLVVRDRMKPGDVAGKVETATLRVKAKVKAQPKARPKAKAKPRAKPKAKATRSRKKK